MDRGRGGEDGFSGRGMHVQPSAPLSRSFTARVCASLPLFGAVQWVMGASTGGGNDTQNINGIVLGHAYR